MACFFHSFLCDGRNRQNSKWTPSLFWRTADYWGGGVSYLFVFLYLNRLLQSVAGQQPVAFAATGNVSDLQPSVISIFNERVNMDLWGKILEEKKGGGGSVVLNSWNTWSFHQNYCVLRVFEKKSGNKHLVLKAWRGSLLFCDPLKTSQGHRWTNPRFHPRRFRETSRHAFKNGQHGWEAIRASFALTPDLLVGVGKGLASD